MVLASNKTFASLNSYFDKIYVLTLEHTKDRQKNIRKVLEGLDWEFFYGADKKQYTMEKVLKDQIYDDLRHKDIKRTSRSMNLGEVACSLSHRRIFQTMLDNNYQRILILEDDVLPKLEQIARFDEVIAQLPEDWELLMMGYYGHKLPILKYRIQQRIYKVYHKLNLFNWHKLEESWIDNICMKTYSPDVFEIGKVLGAHAYAVSASAANKFINYQTPIILQADRIFSYYKASHPISGFALKDTMFTLSELANESYIQS